MACQTPTTPKSPANNSVNSDVQSSEHKAKPHRRQSIPWAHWPIKNIIFGNSTSDQHTGDKDQVGEVSKRQMGSVHHTDTATIPAQYTRQQATSTQEEPGSPSVQAHTLEQALTNGFGDVEQQPQIRNSQGLPESAARSGHEEGVKRNGSCESRKGGEVDDDGSFGWPGLGSWPEHERHHKRTRSQYGWPGLGSWSEDK